MLKLSLLNLLIASVSGWTVLLYQSAGQFGEELRIFGEEEDCVDLYTQSLCGKNCTSANSKVSSVVLVIGDCIRLYEDRNCRSVSVEEVSREDTACQNNLDECPVPFANLASSVSGCSYNAKFNEKISEKQSIVPGWEVTLYEEEKEISNASLNIKGLAGECQNLRGLELCEDVASSGATHAAKKRCTSTDDKDLFLEPKYSCARGYIAEDCRGEYSEVKDGRFCRGFLGICLHKGQMSSISGCKYALSDNECPTADQIGSMNITRGTAEYHFWSLVFRSIDESGVTKLLASAFEKELDKCGKGLPEFSHIQELRIRTRKMSAYFEAMKKIIKLVEDMLEKHLSDNKPCKRLNEIINSWAYRVMGLRTQRLRELQGEYEQFEQKRVQEHWKIMRAGLDDIYTKRCRYLVTSG